MKDQRTRVEEQIAEKLSRPDGRPEAYAVPKLDGSGKSGYGCAVCNGQGLDTFHPADKVAMLSPMDTQTGEAEFLCVQHLPSNVVIYDPLSDLCRDLDGNEWTETEDSMPGVH